VFTGDKVTLIAPQGLVTPAGVLPRLKQFKVVGIFEAGMYEYDSGLALIHMPDAQTLYRMEDRVSGVRLKLDDLFAAPRVARELRSASTPTPSSATGRAATPISSAPCRSRRT
jgi:lipoprotein-releasing system permease protein